MDGRLPLPSLLSFLLVAFIVEFDNEFERQVPHRTTNHGMTPGALHAPWLVSMAMWSKFLRFVPDEGITVRNFKQSAALDDRELHFALTRLGKWWGYLLIDPNTASSARKRFSPDALIRFTSGGRKAAEAWRPLEGTVEQRWRTRFGSQTIDSLYASLSQLAENLKLDLPGFLPILGYGLRTEVSTSKHASPLGKQTGESLVTLLSKVLLAFAVEFERQSEIGLCICANVVRLLGDEPLAIRTLPTKAGVSKEIVATSLKPLAHRGYLRIHSDSTTHSKLVTLTPKGSALRRDYLGLIRTIEQRWILCAGDQDLGRLRVLLESIADIAHDHRLLLQGMKPHAQAWRAGLPQPQALPHFPVITHRGGFPDGA